MDTMTSSAGRGEHSSAADSHKSPAWQRPRQFISNLRIFVQYIENTCLSLLAIGVVAVGVGLVFGVWPRLDLKASALFYDAVQRDWPWARDPTLTAIRDLNEFITRTILAAAVIALLFAAAGARALAIMTPRVAVFLLAVLGLAPGLIANAIFKAHWGRPRPSQVTALGGGLDFVPWWSPFGQCGRNCSFFSGEAAGAFCLLAVAVMLPARYRPIAIAAAIVWGLIVGFTRLAMGGHFLSDVLFAGVSTALVIWLLHGLFFRWRRR
jgi:membrane-associated PAP2 superfamily phosphatase